MTSTRDLTVDTPDGPMRLYEASPATTPRGGVVVIQEAFGINEHIEDVTRRCAHAGYLAVAPDLFHRAGGGTAPYGDVAKVLPLFEGLTDAGILDDAQAALTHLERAGIDAGHTGIVGFCFGGRVTFLVGLHHALGAAVGFYGGGIVTPRFPQFPPLVERVAELRTPWLGLFGDDDASIPVDDVETLRTALAGAPVDTEVVRYPGAGHGFHCDVRPDFCPDDAADAWTRTLAWFERFVG